MQHFERAFASGRDVLCITTASKLSVTHGIATGASRLALASFPDRRSIVLDSATAGGAEALVTLAAARRCCRRRLAGRGGARLRAGSPSGSTSSASWSRCGGCSAAAESRARRCGRRRCSTSSPSSASGRAKARSAWWRDPAPRPRLSRRVLRISRYRKPAASQLHVVVMHAAAPEEAETLVAPHFGAVRVRGDHDHTVHASHRRAYWPWALGRGVLCRGVRYTAISFHKWRERVACILPQSTLI